MKFEVLPYGNEGVLVKFGGVIDVSINEQVIACYYRLKSFLPSDVLLRAGYTDILIKYDYPIRFESVIQFINSTLVDTNETPTMFKGVLHEIPVNFNLKEDDWERITSHQKKPKEELLQTLLTQEYKVMMTGFLPGFPYLGVLPSILHCPRLDNPRTRVPKGSLAVGGEQLGVYPCDAPGGWNIIGHTEMELFDISNGTKLKLGDRIQIVEI